MTDTHRSPVRRGLECLFVKSACHGRADVVGRGVLGRVAYARGGQPPTLHEGAPRLTVHMAGDNTEPFTEIWVTDRPVRAGVEGSLVYAEDGDHIFCAVRIDERGVYQNAVQSAYEQAFALLSRLGYTELFRMWNLVGAITGDNAEGMENYRDFCVGRARAFDKWPGRIPAATGIGSLSPGIDLYFLATRAGVPRHLENPNQTPAYKYPKQYGPKSPSFARATHLPAADGSTGTVYVSGTASIVGDDTVHHDDIAAQVDATLANIEALISPGNLREHGVEGGYGLKDLDSIKVYVRDEHDLPLVRARCAEVFPDHADIAYLNVDVCRPDLLVEIEGIAG
ncbi:FkbO/Hyg5 family chorismatase [Streptomyces uncialis]|uniref:FkbO/Hyg5 family chorismatase n=1 Tax=Streptomyces uncialis TaxID=1048205 RepID=UPI00093F47CA|nr:FkbO/Hyg5 family chorismatase [Streptomyces uncialis]MCX4660593.1 FkbO/Hyg5 family chorismatase [Streptomyces uncialis]WTE12779.1 FkbO/Hyg5 family chorismatase [Streptomyces uncialis]